MKRYAEILLSSAFVLCLTLGGGLMLGDSSDVVRWGPKRAAADCPDFTCNSLGHCEWLPGSGIDCFTGETGCVTCECGSCASKPVIR